MRSFSKTHFFFLCAFLLLVSCGRKEGSLQTKEGYVGHWKLTDPQGNIYFMTLNEDGSCKTTRDGGEFGRWEFKEGHVEAQWIPKTFRLYFNPGQTEPLLKPTVTPEKSGLSIGTKVEKIPD